MRGKAETCEFSANLNCNGCGTRNDLNYTDHMVKDVLLGGIYDPGILREVLGVYKITGKSVNDVVSLIEGKEMAQDANIARSTTFAISTDRESPSLQLSKSKRSLPGSMREPSSAHQDLKSLCAQCGESFSPLSEGFNGWNLEPHHFCQECFRSRRKVRQKVPTPPSVSLVGSTDCDGLGVISHISAISPESESETSLPETIMNGSMCKSSTSTKLDHHIFSSDEWTRARFLDHPMAKLTRSIKKSDYHAFSHKSPLVNPTSIMVKLDTCAQSCLNGHNCFNVRRMN